jgi:RNA binding exosome subunit
MPQLSQYLTKLGRTGERSGLARLEVVSARISAIVHATEDTDRVLQAVRQVFPDGTFPSKPETRKFNGHYGNEIGMITLSVRGTPARLFLEHIWKNLPSCESASILDALDVHLDPNRGLHLRLDKQEASRGRLKMKDQDPIKVHLSFQTRIKSDLGLGEGVKLLLESLENSLGKSSPHSRAAG